METKTVIKMSYNELENIVKKQYPKVKDYSFVAVEEANNDSVYEFTRINKKEYEEEIDMDDEYVKEMLDSFEGLNLFPLYGNRLLLLHLRWLDLIPEGDYIIEVCW